jgi:hypothetical protein
MNRAICLRKKKDSSFFHTLYLLSASLCIVAIMASAGLSEELEVINRPVNTTGLTGLLVTAGPFTIPYKTFEFSFGAISEKSSRPDYSLNQLPSLTVTAGVTEKSELSLGWSYVQKTLTESSRQRGAGNAVLSGKYAILPQDESSSMPAVALIASIAAGGDNKDINLNGIVHWGARIGLAAGREIEWGDHILALYADAQLAVNDLNSDRYRDRYGLLNVGLLVPISKNRNLQMIVEYNTAFDIDRTTPQGGDYSALLYGLRLVTERFNLSLGSQFIHKQVEGFDNSNGVIAMISIKM